MSTVAVEKAVETDHRMISPTVSKLAPAETIDEHPLIPVLIAGIIALALSSGLIGSILLLLSLRHSGVMTP